MGFEAKYRGRCPADDCDGIEPGDQVEYSDGVLGHVDCAAAEATRVEPPVEEPCTDCFLIHKPGLCDA